MFLRNQSFTLSHTDFLLKEFPSPQRLLDAKFRKNLVLTGAMRFNAKPKTGLVFLEENKLIYADLSDEISRARSLALFLKQCTRLDKRLLGDFISRLENEEILTEFIGLFDFKNVGWRFPPC
jgi:brefeldin A-resistance guanine nucleotide exchange factor 1